jgi:hypothetical protein
VSETNGRFKDTIEVSTNSRTIRAIVEDLANKSLLAFTPRVECLYICFTLTGLSKDEQRAIFKYRYKIPTIDI